MNTALTNYVADLCSKSCYYRWCVPLGDLILVMSLWENGDFNNGVFSWYDPVPGAEQRFPTL